MVFLKYFFHLMMVVTKEMSILRSSPLYPYLSSTRIRLFPASFLCHFILLREEQQLFDWNRPSVRYVAGLGYE